MRVLPGSPRVRRRLAWTAGTLGTAAVTAVVVALLPTGAPLPAETVRPGGTPVTVEREVTLTRAERRAIDALLARFVPAAVAREDLGAAWELAGPAMRRATTRSRWLAGNLPVFPYRPRGTSFTGWRLLYAHRDRVALDLLLQPRDRRQGALALSFELSRAGRGWLVDSVYPSAVFAAPSERAWVTGAPDFTASGYTSNSYRREPTTSGRLDGRWLLLPAGLLALVGVVPLVLLAVGRVRARRARAAYTQARGLPPLPRRAHGRVSTAGGKEAVPD